MHNQVNLKLSEQGEKVMALEIRPAMQEELEQFKHVASTALVMKPETFQGMRPNLHSVPLRMVSWLPPMEPGR